MAFTAETFRVGFPIESHLPGLNLLTSQIPVAWRGVDWRFELCLTLGQTLADISGLASLTLEIKSLEDITGPPILTATISAAALNPATTLEQWQSGAAQHAVFEFPHTQTNLDLGGNKKRQFWVVVKGLTNEIDPSRVVGGVTVLTVEEAGANDAEPPTPGNPAYYTAEEIDARIAAYLRTLTADYPLAILDVSTTTDPQHKKIKLSGAGTVGAVLQWNGSAWEPSTESGAFYLRCVDDSSLHELTVKKIVRTVDGVSRTDYVTQLNQQPPIIA